MINKDKTVKHERLKQTARKLLDMWECVAIEEEYSFGNKVPRRKGSMVVVDVIGWLPSGEAIAVECGGSRASKLLKLSKYVRDIYILPHNADLPFIWKPNMKICRACGNKLS